MSDTTFQGFEQYRAWVDAFSRRVRVDAIMASIDADACKHRFNTTLLPSYDTIVQSWQNTFSGAAVTTN